MAEQLFTLIATAGVLLGSPGPAPLALAASSASFGVRNSVPFFCGILGGLLVVIILSLAGVATLLVTWPKLRLILQLSSGIYICYVAFKIASAPIISGGSDELNPPALHDGFILNILNPKAYAAFLAIFSQFLIPWGEQITSYLITAAACMLVATVVDTAWLLSGQLLRNVFAHSKLNRPIRILFAIAMVAMVVRAMRF